MPPTIAAPEVSPQRVAAWLESNDDVQIVDIRPAAQVAAGQIDMAPASRFHNIPAADLLARRTLDGTGLDPHMPAVVVCALGRQSCAVAAHLNDLGCPAHSMTGGMADWMALVLARPLAAPPSLDRFIQFDRPGKGALGYLLVSGSEALIVDPPRDTAAYLDAVAEARARVVGVADTHVHADYISGGPMLARRLDVPYYLHPSDACYPYDGTPGRIDFRPLAGGNLVRVGRCDVRVVHTPGHTEGSVCFVVDDAAALTGDFIFVASVGRPDLAGKTTAWTVDLWHSLETIRRLWSDELVIYPAHYAAQHERRADGTVAAPLGQLLRDTEALRFTDHSAFSNWVAARTGSFPDAYRRIKGINIGLETPDAATADELDFGRNQCSLG